MTGTTFATAVAPAVEPAGVGKDTTVDGKANVEVPYTEYEREVGKPYIVDHYKLGDNWKDKLGGFQPEVTLIEEFISSQIDKGEIPNNLKAVQETIKSIEKMTNVDKNERPTIKLETMAAYVKFLMSVDKIHFNTSRYGYN
jgi:hypothetical protein